MPKKKDNSEPKEPKERKVEKSDLTSAERLFLLRDYLAENANEENPITRKDLQDYLQEHGIPRTEKTFYRDVEKLNYLGYEVCYVVNKGYYLANPTFEPYELRLMVDGVQSLKFITQSKADEITNKIKMLTDKYTAYTLNRQSYVANRIRSMNEPVIKGVDVIHYCISENQKVAFRFFHYDTHKEKH